MAEFGEEDFQGRLNLSLWRGIIGRAWRGYRRNLLWLGGSAIVCAACDSTFNLFSKWLVDCTTAHIEHRPPPMPVAWIAAGFAAMVVTLAAGIRVFIIHAGAISNGLSNDMRREAFRKLQDLSFSYYDKHATGWVIARLTGDCDRLGRVIGWGMLDILWGTVLLTIVTIVMFVMDYRLALAVLAVTPLLALASHYFQKRILMSSRRMRKTNSLITAGFAEGLAGVKTTKAFVAQRPNEELFGTDVRQLNEQAVHNALLNAAYFPTVVAMGAVSSGLVLWLGGKQVLASQLPIGTLVAFIGFAGQFFHPVGQIARILADFQGAQASAERVASLLATVPDIVDSPAVRERLAGAGGARPAGMAEDGLPDSLDEVRCEDVSFAYAEGKPVLSGVTLVARQGKSIALVGPTGGGKTTLISLLCRFYEPTGGRILLDGVEYRERGLHWYQSKLGVILQSPHLFSDTIMENIRFGRPLATDDAVIAAATLVGAHEAIDALPDKYQSKVGEGGSRLSTGQKQLICFARAVLADPRILILDEATSSVDTQAEALIQRATQQLMAGRITFIIAHRLSTIRRADEILYIEAGRVVERGTHEQLLAARSRYYHLHRQQSRIEREKRMLHGDTVASAPAAT